MKRCDPNARAKCPDGEYCELYAEFADGSWCDDFNKKVLKLPMTNANRADDAPTVEVVRCEECLYRSQYSDKNGMYHCGGIDTTKDHVLPVVAPDFFCAHGERRVNENC